MVLGSTDGRLVSTTTFKTIVNGSYLLTTKVVT